MDLYVNSNYRNRRWKRWILLILPVLLLSVERLAGQAFSAPGAVALLEQDAVEEFPDSEFARIWLKSFRLPFDEQCPSITNLGLLERSVKAGVDISRVPVNLANYLSTDLTAPVGNWGLIGSGDPGYDDGQIWLQINGCDAAETVWVTIDAVMIRNGAGLPNPGDAPTFARLLSQEVRAELGFREDGRRILSSEDRAVVASLVEPLARYLRTRQFGRISDSDVERTARQIAEILVRGDLSRQTMHALLAEDDGGQPIIRLATLPSRARELAADGRPSRPPFAPDQDPYDAWLEDQIRQLERIFGRVLGSGSHDRQMEVAKINAVEESIREILPPALQQAFLFEPTGWTPPAAATTGTVTGRVRGLTHNDIPRTVWVEARRRQVTPEFEVDDDGRFTIPEVPSGNIVVRAGYFYFRPFSAEERIQLEPGTTRTVDLEIRCTIPADRDGLCEYEPPEQPSHTERIRSIDELLDAGPTPGNYAVAMFANGDEVSAAAGRYFEEKLEPEGMAPKTVFMFVLVDSSGTVRATATTQGTVVNSTASDLDSYVRGAVEVAEVARFIVHESAREGVIIPGWAVIPIPFYNY